MSVIQYGAACEPGGVPIKWGPLDMGVTPEPTHRDCEGGLTKRGLGRTDVPE